MLWLTVRQLRSSNVAHRRKAAETLSRLLQPRAFEELCQALGDEDAEVRRLAVLAIARFDDVSCLEPLLGMLRDRNEEVLKAAILALKRPFCNQSAIGPLCSLLSHPDSGVRGCAAQVLEFLGWRPGAKEEELWLTIAKGKLARAATFGSAAVPALESVLSSSPSSLGVAAVGALGTIGDQRALRSVMLSLKSSDPSVCIAAIDAARKTGAAQFAEAIASRLKHGNAQIRVAAAEALGLMRFLPVAERLRPLLRDNQWDVRKAAVEALGRIGDIDSVMDLTRMLADEDGDVREATAMALGTLADRRAIGPLVKALKDETSGVRRIAAGALSLIDERWSSSPEARSAVEELKVDLAQGDSDVRYFVEKLLISLGAAGPATGKSTVAGDDAVSSPAQRRKLAVTLFIAVLSDPDRDLRQAAAESLGRIGDNRAEAALTRALCDDDPGVQFAAQQALPLLKGRL